MEKIWASGCLLVVVAGCAVTRPVQDRSDVSAALEERTGHGTTVAAEPGQGVVPDGVELTDGLSEEEAVAIGLWNNPAFQSDLAQLGFARGELVQAGLLRNPVLSLLFPWGPKQLESSLAWPLESLWRRPRRVSVARTDLERVAQSLVQNGLDLAMNIKIAHSELSLAFERARLSGATARVAEEIEQLTEARLRAGDASEVEVSEAQATALEAQLASRHLAHEVDAAGLRLAGLLGIAAGDVLDVRPQDADRATPSVLPDLPQLLEAAYAARPDLRAAELQIEAAGEKAGLARTQYLSLTAIVDANAEGVEGFEVGPGLQLALPLFDRGQADRILGAAEIERAVHGYAAARNRIAAAVREAYAQFADGREALDYSLNQIVPIWSERVRSTERLHEAGEASYLSVVLARARHLDALSRHAGASADLRRARARLENAIGIDLDRPSGIGRSP